MLELNLFDRSVSVKKKLRWVMLIAVLSLIVFVVIYIYNGRYVWNYFSAIGVRENMTMEQLVLIKPFTSFYGNRKTAKMLDFRRFLFHGFSLL